MKMNRCARVGVALGINIALGWLLIRSGAADALWRMITPEVEWRTGPVWWAVLVYAGALFGLHVAVNLPLQYWLDATPIRIWADDLIGHGASFVVGACLVVVTQVLMPATWWIAMAALLAGLLPITSMIETRAGKMPPIPPRVLAASWMWLALGLLIAHHFIPRWTFGTPPQLPRLALFMTVWLALPRLLVSHPGARLLLMWTPSWACCPPN